MANEEQLSILKQGVEVWNKWRKDTPDVEIDLSGAMLMGDNLNGTKLKQKNHIADEIRRVSIRKSPFSEANVDDDYAGGAFLMGADLSKADLNHVNLYRANLNRTNLYKANLFGANLSLANLSRADLKEAILLGARLRKTNLKMADLRGTNLVLADFYDALLNGAQLSSAEIGRTIFRNLDLREAIGLDEITHSSPSDITTSTFARSTGKIPEIFLRGCGLSDWEIEQAKLHNPDLGNEEINNIQYKIYDLRATQALQISPLFISYSHGDSTFVDNLESQLNKKGIRFWRDSHDMKAGRIEKQIDAAISQNRTVLLILSEHSIKSDWVEHEVRTARGMEKDMGRDMLCPIALDDSWKSSPWPKRVMEQIMEYNILDFSAWEDDVKFEGMFRKLIDGLELFYKG